MYGEMTKKKLVLLERRLLQHGYKKIPYFLSDRSFCFDKYLVKEDTCKLRISFQTWDHSDLGGDTPCSAKESAILFIKDKYVIRTEVSSRENLDIESLEKFASKVLNLYKDELLKEA